MNKNENIMNFYLKNISSNYRKVLACLIAIKQEKVNITKIIKLIMYDELDISMLSNQQELIKIQNEIKENLSKESKISNHAIEISKEINEQDLNNIRDLQHIFGTMLIALGIENEYKYYLDYKKLYIGLLSNNCVNNEKFINANDITMEYINLINQLEYDLRIKLYELQSLNEQETNFEQKYERNKKNYQMIPCLRGILEQAKKL